MPTCNSIRLELVNYIHMQKSLSLDKTCFERFFQHEDIVGLLDRFVIYHVDAPGQVRVNTLLFPGVFSLSLGSEMIVSTV